MPKISYISPKLLVQKFSQLLQGQLPKTEEKVEESYAASEWMESNEASLSDSKIQISLRDIKLMHTSLVHFHKYLKAKGQATRAQEVEELHQRVAEFIRRRDQV